MPEITNTYTPSDLTDWVEFSNDLAWSTEGTHVVTTPGGNGTLKVEGNGSYSGTDTADYTDGTASSGSVTYRGVLDISDIPSDAIIQQIVLRIIAESTGEAASECQGTSTRSGGGACSISASANSTTVCSLFFDNVAEALFITAGHIAVDNDSDGASTPPDGIAAGADSNDSGSSSKDFTDPEFVNLSVTKADFISLGYSTLQMNVECGGNINCSVQFTGTNSSELATGEGAVATTLEITDWEFDITFFTEDVDTPLVEEIMEDPSGYELGGSSLVEDVVIIVDISGIYVLVPNKRDDSWYDREGDPGDTIDVKIPDPFVSLAFLPEDE